MMNTMKTNLLNDLKKNVPATALTATGVNGETVEKSLQLAVRTTGEVVKKALATEPDAVTMLFSAAENTPKATELEKRISNGYSTALTKELGLNALAASAIKDAVIPGMSKAVVNITKGDAASIRTLFSES